MAVSAQLGEIGGFVDKRRATLSGHGRPSTFLTNVVNYTDRTAMETSLLTHGYTQAQLNQMNMNDVLYALRLATDSAGI